MRSRPKLLFDLPNFNSGIKGSSSINYIITKKYIERAEADIGFIMTAYNLRRLINLIDMKRTTLESRMKKLGINRSN